MFFRTKEDGRWGRLGTRRIYQPLADELARQQHLFEEFFAAQQPKLAKAAGSLL